MSTPTIPSFSSGQIGEPRAAGHTSPRLTLAVALVVSMALWYIPVAHFALYPIRLFMTFIHEGGHALVTVLTGGHVNYVTVAPDGSGLTLSAGGLFALISMAGYIGATAYGAFCLQLSHRRNGGRQGLVLLAASILLITGFWVNPIGAGFFTFVTGAIIGVALLAAARKLPERQAAFLLSFLAIQLALNAIVDLRTLLWLTSQTHADNDAVFMAQAYGLAPWFWSFLWAAISGVILAVGLRAWWRATK
jgi:hypothetical protein